MKTAKNIWHILSGVMDSIALNVIIPVVKSVAIFRERAISVAILKPPTANTLFHRVKFGVRKAFFICFEMSTSTKSLSASYMGICYGVTEKTARLFMHKVREAMKSSENNPMDGEVHVDEFVIGGK